MQSLLPEPNATLRIRFLSSDEGGRIAAPKAGVFATVLEVQKKYFDCRIDLSAWSVIEPDTTVIAPVQFLHPELALPELTSGTAVSLWEGKIIARGDVVSLENR